MNSWLIYPTWQNFSSLFREATMAAEEQSEFLRTHHLTSSLYYAISFVEALLNEEYRRRLEADNIPEAQIITILKGGSSALDPSNRRSFARKFCEWPSLICGKQVTVSEQLKKVLTEFNEIRGNLTHPKSRGYDVYADLEKVSGQLLLEAVAEYAISIYSGLDIEYPYWLFGWNYLNPTDGGYDPTRISNQQFLHSLEYLGFHVRAFDAEASDVWRAAHMKNFSGYIQIAKFLASSRHCEPFDPGFPLRPRLVRRWWDSAILEKNKDYVVRRSPPVTYGTVRISPMMIAPLQVFEKPISSQNKS